MIQVILLFHYCPNVLKGRMLWPIAGALVPSIGLLPCQLHVAGCEAGFYGIARIGGVFLPIRQKGCLNFTGELPILSLAVAFRVAFQGCSFVY